jgi:hypothetical protein
VAKFRYLGTTPTNQNFVRGEIKRKLNSGNASYHSVWNILSSSFQSKNLNIRIYIDITTRVVVCGCDTWSLTQRGIHKLRMFDNRVLRKIFGPKRKEVTGECRRLHNKELFDLYSLPNPNRILSAGCDSLRPSLYWKRYDGVVIFVPPAE